MPQQIIGKNAQRRAMEGFMRSDVTEGQILLAVVKAAEALLDRGKWMELGLRTGTLDYIMGHDRLLRSLRFSDDDYSACVFEAMPVVLGRPPQNAYPVSGSRTLDPAKYPHLKTVEEFLSLPHWLEDHEPALHRELYAGEGDVSLDDLQAAAADLRIEDVDVHAARIRRGLEADPAQAIGSSKELLETVLKAILDLHGSGAETKIEIPQLLHQASIKLGLHAGGHRDGGPGSEQRRRLFSALSSIVTITAELRNAGFGTGHGGVQRPELDLATARLVVSAATAIATFYLEAHVGSHLSPRRGRRREVRPVAPWSPCAVHDIPRGRPTDQAACRSVARAFKHREFAAERGARSAG